MRKILVTGSREWADAEAIESALREHTEVGDVLIHGDAKGADRIADRVVEWFNLVVIRCPARWFKTPLERNKFMVWELKPDICLAFAHSWGSGTGQCARQARKAGIETVDYGVDTK